MIEDEGLGLKVAENKTEALWGRVKSNTEKEIENLENELIINKEILELAKNKLEVK